MGQKVHPYGFRVGYNKDWHSHWYTKQDFAKFLAEDLQLKRELKRKFTGGGVSHIDIERAATRMKIIIYTSRPGIIIGRKVLRSKSFAKILLARRSRSSDLDPGDSSSGAECPASGREDRSAA
jgi:small subunit ribosomal protein S3